MFIGLKHHSGLDRHDQQVAAGYYLILFCRDWTKHLATPEPERRALTRELRAAVRYVHLSQLGHFMMGAVTVGRHRIALSGPYGQDGLPRTLPEKPDGSEDLDYWHLLYPVPPELAEQYWSGNGHNSTGKEAPAMRRWALDHIEKLRASGTAERTRGLHRTRYAPRKETQTNGQDEK